LIKTVILANFHGILARWLDFKDTNTIHSPACCQSSVAVSLVLVDNNSMVVLANIICSDVFMMKHIMFPYFLGIVRSDDQI